MGTVAAKATDASGNAATASVAYSVGTTVVECVDFAAGNSGFAFAGGLAGAGTDATAYRMKTGTSTKAATINALAAGSTNPYRLMRFGSFNSSTPTPNLDVGGFTMQATEQGSDYGGMQIAYSPGIKLHDIKAAGFPGSAPGPPGETFSIEFLRTDSPVVSDVTLDGRDASGTPVSATMLALSYTPNGGTFDRVKAQYAQDGFSFAVFQSAGVYNFTDCDFSYSRKALNIEDSKLATYNFTRCTFKGITGAAYIAQVSSKTTSCVVNFRDPAVDSWPLMVRTYPSNGPQLDSDVHCFIGGVEVTGDPTKFLITHSG